MNKIETKKKIPYFPRTQRLNKKRNRSTIKPEFTTVSDTKPIFYKALQKKNSGLYKL